MTIKVTCWQCGNPKFGMMRYYLRGKVFDKMSCRNAFVAGEPRKNPPEEVIYKPPNKAYDVIS